MRAGLCYPGVNPEKCQLAYKRVGHHLESERRERPVIVGRASQFLAGVGMDALNRWDVERRGHVLNHCVEQRLYALVLESRAAQDRIDLQAAGRPAYAG